MYFARIDVRLYDALYSLQSLQQLVVIVGLISIGYLLLRKKAFTHRVKLWLWGLALIWTIAGTVVFAYDLHTYIRDIRPVYQKSNSSETGL